MVITRRFRRSLQQELTERKRLTLVDAIGIGVLALILASATRWPLTAEWLRTVVWGAIVAGAYFLVKLGSAQVRARAQPFDHTLTLREEGVEVRDNLRDRTSRFGWEEVERVAITDRAFEIRRRGSERGESYLISRAKLSREEERFLGERLIEL